MVGNEERIRSAEESLALKAAKSRDGRSAKIMRASLVGILANVLLAAFKAAVGLAVHSVAVVMDAVNNLSDAASSVITIIGTRLAGKQPDKKHPFGYGRVEYLSAMIISVLVLYAGITAFVESVKKILHPDVPDYGATALLIVAAAVVVKILLGRYVKSVGESVNSDALINSGQDALMDSVISASTLVAAGIYLTLHISLEAWLGAVIAVIIVKSGVEMLRETLSRILGESADAELLREIKKTILAHPEISGAYDMILHNYGPDSYQGSVHVEVPDTLSADQLDQLIRRVTVEIYQKHDVIMTAIGVYSLNTKDPAAVEIRERVRGIAMAHPHVLQVHGFYLDQMEKTLRFDVVISFDAPDRAALYREICSKVQQAYPEYTLQTAMDTDFAGEEQ